MIGEEEEEFLKLQKAQTNKEKISLTKDICHSYNRQGLGNDVGKTSIDH